MRTSGGPGWHYRGGQPPIPASRGGRCRSEGVLPQSGRIAPHDAWRALRDVAQRTGSDLDDVAVGVLRFALGGDLPDQQLGELRRAVDRYATDSGADTPVRA
ncbi:hypothetical protein [Streptomyces sp. NPDC047079]|uniref:hypothetical protein n=1 Tax=Streptomyces sp. NPDC047079 TaxID=3154607 RepID=UPI0033C2FD93